MEKRRVIKRGVAARRVNVRRVRDSKEDYLQKDLPVLEEFIAHIVGDAWDWSIRDNGSYMEVVLEPKVFGEGPVGVDFHPVLTYDGARYGSLETWCARFEDYIASVETLMGVAYEGSDVADLGVAVSFIRDVLPVGAGCGWDEYENSYWHVVETVYGTRIELMLENEEASDMSRDLVDAYAHAAKAMGVESIHWSELCSVTRFLVRVADSEGEDRDVIYKQSPSWLDVRQIVRAVESLGTDFTFASAVEELSKWS